MQRTDITWAFVMKSIPRKWVERVHGLGWTSFLASTVGLLLGGILTPMVLQAQELPRRELDLRQFILEWEENEGNMEDLFFLVQHPVDLNTASREEIESLFFLSPRQVQDIVVHRARFGAFLSLYELQVLPSFSSTDILKMQAFVQLSRSKVKARVTEHYLVYRTDFGLEPSKGFRDSVFAGGRTRQYIRYKYQKGNDFSLGILTEKDPGEKELWDHQVFSLQWKNRGRFKQIILGDYYVHWGQGLMMGSGFKLGKGAEPVLGTKRGADGFRVHQSVTEAGGFRGSAVHWGKEKWQSGSWVSMKRVDANRSGSEFSSLQSAGLHRTESELEDRNAVTESQVGTFIKYRKAQWQLGVAALFTRFDAEFVKANLPYTYFQFRGNQYGIASLAGTYYGKNYLVFSELAYAKVPAWVAGLAYSASKKWEVGVHLRHYPEKFRSLYGAAFGENTLPQNEVGQYLGIKFTPKKQLFFSGHYDRYRFPWIKFGERAPMHGSDFAFRMQWQAHKKQQIKMVLRAKNGTEWNRNPSYTGGALLTWDRKWVEAFHTQSTWQVKLVNGRGQAWVQDIEGKWKNLQWRGRVAWFSTDSYDSRIYAYENDVLYTSSFSAYSGKGFRFYMNVKVRMNRNIDLWVRWARSRVADTIGSGWDELTGNKKTDFRLQLRYQF